MRPAAHQDPPLGSADPRYPPAEPGRARPGRHPTRRRVAAIGLGLVGLGAATAATTIGIRRLPTTRRDTLGLLSVFGAPGTFAGLARSGTVATVDVPGFGFGPGHAAFMSTATDDGTVFIGTTPFTDDPIMPTASTMEVGAFYPGTGHFDRIMIPSSAGHTSVPSPNPAHLGVGGADVADLVVLMDPDGGQRVLFVSAMPYHGWDTRANGQFPSIGQLRRDGAGIWRYEPDGALTGDDLAGLAPPAAAGQAFPAAGPTVPRSARAPVSIVRLPRSGHLVIAQYFGTPGGTRSGALLVLGLDGRTRAWWQYPATTPLGTPTVVNPREVVADPTSEPDDERFVLISDCFTADGVTLPFPVQEFSYSASTGQIVPRSAPVRATQDGTRMESACFDHAGNLYVARTRSDGLRADAMAVYAKIGRERSLVTRAPATPGWPDLFGIECRPDYFLAETARGGLVRSFTADPVTGAILLAGLEGLLQVVRASGSGEAMTFSTTAIELGLDHLRGPASRYIGVRRAAIDGPRRLMWLPVNQMVLDAIPWPYPPFRLDQWLFRIDLDMLLRP